MNLLKGFLSTISLAVAGLGILFAYISYDYIPNLVTIGDAEKYEYDYIIVGAGTAGCVLANRLSENPNISVLLIEAGSTFGAKSIVPLLSTMMQQTKEDWSFKSTPQQYSSFGLLENRQNLPRGKGLGGSSQINYLLHFKGLKEDFETWEHHGAIGFGYTNLKNYLNVDGATNFTLRITSENNSRFTEILMEMAKEIVSFNGDVQLAEYNTWKGIRWSVYQQFLRPAFRRKNLKILTDSRVHKILFNANKQATAVRLSPEMNLKKISQIVARKEIVLSAGAIQTPQILKLSGIGEQMELTKLGINVIHDASEIGENLYDHLNMPIFVSVNESISITRDKVLNLSAILRYLVFGNGIFSNFGVTGIVNANNADYGLAIFGIGSVDEDILSHLANYKRNVFRALFPRFYNTTQEGFILLCSCHQPKSRGSIKLQTKNPKSEPLINPNYLKSNYDIECMINSIRMAREIVQTKIFQRLNAKIHWPMLKECGNFGPTNEEDPSDRYLECMIRVGSVTGHHPGGTCSMGTNISSPLDHKMRVRGVHGLRVVDASILPTPISGTPSSVLVAVAQRAADIILEN